MGDGFVKVDARTKARVLPDGEIEVVRHDDWRAGLKAKAEMRKARRHGHAKDDDTFQAYASTPKCLEGDIIRECGDDPDLRKAWIRDHPEHLTVPPNEAHLPRKRTTFFMGGRK